MLFFLSKGVFVTHFCNEKDCSVYGTCREVSVSMQLPEGVMEEMMLAMSQTANYLIVKNSVRFDFDLNGINLRNYYNKLLEISDQCRA